MTFFVRTRLVQLATSSGKTRLVFKPLLMSVVAAEKATGKGYTAVKKPTHGANKKAACLHKYNDELLLVVCLCIHYKYRNTYIAGKSRSS